MNKTYRCEECESQSIVVKAFINFNTYKLDDFSEDKRVWCNECDEYVEVEEAE